MTNSHSILEQLQHEYQENPITLKHIDLVSDEEVKTFLAKRDTFWSALFWTMFICSILLAGVISK